MRTRTLTHSRKAKLLTALAVLALAGAASGLAAAGSSSVSTPRLGSDAIVPPDKAAALADRMPSTPTDATAPAGAAAAATAFAADPIPATMLGSDVPVPIPASVLMETSGWLVSNGNNLVAVYAGATGDDPTQGRVVIVRQDLRAGKQTVQILDAGSTGPLTIDAGAPTGAAVETSAQTGTLMLTATHGATAKLNLSTNTVSAK